MRSFPLALYTIRCRVWIGGCIFSAEPKTCSPFEYYLDVVSQGRNILYIIRGISVDFAFETSFSRRTFSVLRLWNLYLTINEKKLIKIKPWTSETIMRRSNFGTKFFSESIKFNWVESNVQQFVLMIFLENIQK